MKEVPLEAAQEVEDLPVSHRLVPVLCDEALLKALALPEGHQVNEVSPEAADRSAAQQQLAGRYVSEQLQQNVLWQLVYVAYSHGGGSQPAPGGGGELRYTPSLLPGTWQFQQPGIPRFLTHLPTDSVTTVTELLSDFQCPCLSKQGRELALPSIVHELGSCLINDSI